MALFEKQIEFVKALRSRQYEYLLYGGGVGGGKTIVSLGVLDEMAQNYPGTRYAVVRKSLTALRRNTIPSFRKILELNGDYNRAKLYKSEWTYQYKNGSEILLVEADFSTDPDFFKLRGLEVTAAVLEEGNELHPKAFDTMITRIGRWKNLEYDIPQFMIITCNPSNGWLKQMFYDKWSIKKLDSEGNETTALEKPYYFLQSLPHDNPYNTTQYLESLENLQPAEYQKYVKGNWEFADDPNQLVEYQWLKDNIIGAEELDFRVPKYLGIDVAREGNDETKFCYMDDSTIIKYATFRGLKTNEIGDQILIEKAKYGLKDDHIAVDGIGIGAGVIDYCESKGCYIREFKSSEKPTSELQHFRFKNRKAEAYWFLREDLRTNNIQTLFSEDFNRQCLQIRYFTTESYIIIESKKELKKRIHESPDEWDSAVIANVIRRDLLGEGSLVSGYIDAMFSDINTYDDDDTIDLDYNPKTCVMEMVY